MDFNRVLELLREGQSPAWIIDNWWRDLAKENNIGEVTAKELATRQVATAQQVIEAQKEGYTPTEREQDERGVIIEGDVVTSEAEQVQEAIRQRGGGGLIYRNADAIIALSDAARPPGYTDADIKKSIEDGQGWDPTFGKWYEKDEYLAELDKNLDVVTDAWRLSQIKSDASKNWDNDKAVTIDLEKITRRARPDTWGVKKITDLPTGEAPTVAGEDVTAAVDPSAAATTITDTGAAAATKEAAQPTGTAKVGGALDTGLDIDKLSKLGVTPTQMARGLPTMLPGGTSPFVARGYSSILQNYTEIFPMIALAGLVPGFEVGDEMDATMAMASLDNPQVFAAFIKQKPEDIAKDIKTTLELLESAKELNAADGEWYTNNLTSTKGLLLAHFVNEADQYNRIGGKELALRQTLGRMGKPKWLGDLIANQLEKNTVNNC